MTASLPQQFPDIETLLALEPEELAPYVFRSALAGAQNGKVHLGNFLNSLFAHPGSTQSYADRSRNDEVLRAVAEAWNWLEVQGVLISGDNAQYGWRMPSRRAASLTDQLQFSSFARSRKLDRRSLHPRLEATVWHAFIRGQFDVAVLLAMKAVEVAVREAIDGRADLVGVPLMRVAFDAKKGKLTDLDAEFSEREARAHLFAGAIGAYKNSQSHRDVNLEDPDEALELVMLANHLLRLVDQRRTAQVSL